MNFKEHACLHAQKIETLQVNVGLTCNLNCGHCYWEASPDRKESMEWPVMERIVHAAGSSNVAMVDITGGAPELNPHLKRFISALSTTGVSLQVRTNLTVLDDADIQDFLDFYRDHNIQLVASMPCYLKENVEAQRGKGVYEKSIRILQKLNELGYASDPDLSLSLVYNPGAPSLPPDQSMLEAAYKKELGERYGIRFNKLLTITNMPIGRFLNTLRINNTYESYMNMLRDSFNPATLENVMCLSQLNISWNGMLYDCDFNQALGMFINDGPAPQIGAQDLETYIGREIVTGNHCYGCTAGSGSSCGGALLKKV